LEHVSEGRSLNIGTRYNFMAGKIRYWLSYGLPLPIPYSLLEAAVSDDIGVGQIYFSERWLDRARNGRAGVRLRIPDVFQARFSAGRTSWRLAPYNALSLEESGLTDSVMLQATTGETMPESFEPLDPWESSLRIRHAFRGLGGGYHFDKVEALLFQGIRGLRSCDEVWVRGFIGGISNVVPALPARETFALGGATAIKGYGYEEFRGEGMTFWSAEYGLLMPFSFGLARAGVRADRVFVLGFTDEGRIDSGWFRPAMPWKHSGGVGLRFDGSARQYRGILRLYLAQAEGMSTHRPVFYFLVEVK
jgi:hypothetical protein